MISLQGRSLLQYRCRFGINQDQLLHESISQDQSLHESLYQDQSLHESFSQDQSLLNRDLPPEPELNPSNFRVQSHQSSAWFSQPSCLPDQAPSLQQQQPDQVLPIPQSPTIPTTRTTHPAQHRRAAQPT